MKITYLLNGTPVNPVKSEDIYIEVNHDQEYVINQAAPHVGINNLRFANEDVRRVMLALNQSPGITEGIPFDIVISERGQTETIRMYLNLMKGFSGSREGIKATVQMRQSLDWLNDKIDAFTFESMYNETGVKPFVVDGINYNSYQEFFDKRCIYIPYVISSVPNFQDGFLAIFGMTYIGVEISRVIKEIEATVAGLVNVFAWDNALKLAIQLAFAALLLATLIGLINQLIACLIQPVKYHGAMLMSDLLKVTAAKLGLEFKSSIWNNYPYNQIAYLPEKYQPVETALSVWNILGFNVKGIAAHGYTSPAYAPSSAHDSQTPNIQHGYFNGTAGDLLRLAKMFCNGKYILPDQTNELVLERRDYFPANTPYQLPDIRQDWSGFNTGELDATIILKFIADLSDKNCIDNIDVNGNPFYSGTILQATHQQVYTNDASLICLEGLREINIPAARGANKTQLTFIEKIVGDIEILWHGITDVFIAGLDALIIAANLLIDLINVFVKLWNLIIDVLHIITNTINGISDALDTIGLGFGHIDIFSNDKGKIPEIKHISKVPFQPLASNIFTNRINTLLLENDMVDVPKLLLVDTQRAEFGGGKRIAYLHNDNSTVINAKWLWDKFYSIDAFVGAVNSRATKIAPALNHPDEINRTTLSLADFKNLVNNPMFADNFGEPVIADSIDWYPGQNGAAEFTYRKRGWLADPQNPDGAKRSKEIEINNIKLQITVPNGQ